MARSPNAQLAVDQFKILQQRHRWGKADAWQGIARLLLTCDRWVEGSGWQNFHGVVVYRETNDFKVGKKGPNKVLQRAESLSTYLATQLGVTRGNLCRSIAQYWQTPVIANLQPHNLVGHAFRSIAVTALEMFGDNGLSFEEEVDPTDEFPGFTFATRSKDARIDIVARRGSKTVALISSRWRYRHDRVDVVEEALSYVGAARRQNPSCSLYALVGEFAPNRLEKILSNCPPATRNAALSAAVHFAPNLITQGLNENGRLAHLKSLEWLIDESFKWR